MATVAWRGSRFPGRARPTVFSALLGRTLRDGRSRTIGFALLFGAVSYLQPLAYRHAYPTLGDRVKFAHSFANNKAVVLFYGKAYDLLTVGGYTAWRVGGTLAIFAAAFGMLSTVRALRGEEETGRTELVLSAAVGRSTAFAASMSAIAIETVVLGTAAFAGLLAGGLPASSSAYLSLAVVSVVPVFAGIGALASQVAPSKRTAVELGAASVAVSLLLRVIADTSATVGWLRWLTPLGWAEELRPFTGARPLVLLTPLAAGGILIFAAARIAARRDVGSGLLPSRDTAAPRLELLCSATAQAVRSERVGLFVWMAAVGSLALVIGVVSKSVSSLGISKQLERTLEKLGAGSALTPKAYIGFSFSFIVLAIALFAVSQVTAARHEESEGRLETVLALPLSRRRWLGGRLALAAGGLCALALWAGLLAWAGALSQGVSLSPATLLGAGANSLPVAILFLGFGTLAYGAAPRAGVGIAYGLLIVSYLWQLVGSLLGASRLLVEATPFAHVGAVPAAPFRPGAAAGMVAIRLAASIAATAAFGRRDLTGA